MKKDIPITKEFIYMLHLAGCGARGTSPFLFFDPLDWELILAYAKEQTVLPLVACGLFNDKEIKCPENIRIQALRCRRDIRLRNYLRAEEIIRLMRRAEVQGLKMLLIKGFAVAQSYAEPEVRTYGDVNILISKEDENRAHQFLRNQGFIVLPRQNRHSYAHHPTIGMMELHVDLLNQQAQDVWVQNIIPSEAIHYHEQTISSKQGSFRTLDATSHMAFLILHLVKHFLSLGASITMILDIAAFWEKNAHSIDMKKLDDMLEEINCKRLLATIVRICDTYCGFSIGTIYPMQKVSEYAVALFLADLEKGRTTGKKESSPSTAAIPEGMRQKVDSPESSLGYVPSRVKKYILKFKEVFFPSREVTASTFSPTAHALSDPLFIKRFHYTRGRMKTVLGRHHARKAVCQSGEQLERAELLRELGIS